MNNLKMKLKGSSIYHSIIKLAIKMHLTCTAKMTNIFETSQRAYEM